MRAFSLFVVIAALIGRAHASEPGPLSLEIALQKALQNNERAQKAPLRVRVAQGQFERSRAAFLPTLQANGNGSLSSVEDRAGRNVSATGTVSIVQPLLNLSAIPLLWQSRHQLDSEKWGAVEDQRILAFDTARAFMIVLTNQQVLDAAQQRLARAKVNQQNAEARAQAQIASTNDVTRALLDTAGAAREVAQAEGNLQRAYLSLGFLMGETIHGPLSPPTSTTDSAEAATGVHDQMKRDAEARRPDLRSMMARTLALSAAAKEPLYRLAPTLSLSGQVRLNTSAVGGPMDVGATPFHDESMSLSLSWTLYDAGARYADRKSRLAQAESQALDEKLLRRSIAVDVETAMVALDAARSSYRISQDAVLAAERNTNEAQVLYQQGLGRAIELVDANLRRFEAEVTRATAQLAMQQAYLELRFSLGQDPIDGLNIARPEKTR